MASRSCQRLYIDANCFIYLFESHPVFGHPARSLFSVVEQGKYKALTSTLTLLEVMAGPIKYGKEELAHEYAELISTFPNLTLCDMNQDVACRAARFRASGVKSPDSIHLATAVVCEADYFITEDSCLCKIAGIHGLALSSFKQNASHTDYPSPFPWLRAD